jgi:biopolymer transport protein ExbD
MNFRRHIQGAGSSLSPFVALVNVALLLLGLFAGGLAFFPATVAEVALELPVVAAGPAVEILPGEGIIQIATNNLLAWNNELVTGEGLRDRLRQYGRERVDAAVLVRADRRVPFCEVVAVLEACRSAEIDRWRVLAMPEAKATFAVPGKVPAQ